MNKHLADHRAPATGVRTRRMVEAARQDGAEGSHPATQALSQRPQDRSASSTRMREYLRIDRGEDA